MKFISKLIIAVICLQFLLVPAAAVYAQSSLIPACLLSHTVDTTEDCNKVDLFIELAVNIGRYLFSFIGALALLFFVYGGVILITSQGNKENISKGTKAMVAAATGLVVAFSGYALITFLSQSIGVKADFSITPQSTAEKK